MAKTEITLSRRDFALCASGFLVLLGASGADAVLNHGLHDPAAVKAAATRLNFIPAQIGTWTSSLEAIDERERRMAEIVERSLPQTDDVRQSEAFLEEALPEIRRRLQQP